MTIHRRSFLRVCLGVSTGVWLTSFGGNRLHAREGGDQRALIFLWMNGGPSHLDTFDPKPGHANGGLFRAIPTTAPECRSANISRNWPGK